MKVLFLISLLFFHSAFAVDEPGKSGGNLYELQNKTVDVSVLMGVGMTSIFPDLEHLISSFPIVRVARTFKKGHSAEFTFLRARDEGVAMYGYGIAYRPYYDLEIIAPYMSLGMNYFKISTYQAVGNLERPNAEFDLNTSLGGGALFPFSDSAYARAGLDFYFQPGTTLVLSMGVTAAF